jgi:hypothetical protein
VRIREKKAQRPRAGVTVSRLTGNLKCPVPLPLKAEAATVPTAACTPGPPPGRPAALRAFPLNLPHQAGPCLVAVAWRGPALARAMQPAQLPTPQPAAALAAAPLASTPRGGRSAAHWHWHAHMLAFSRPNLNLARERGVPRWRYRQCRRGPH